MILKVVYGYLSSDDDCQTGLQKFYESSYFEFHDEMEEFYAINSKGERISLGDIDDGTNYYVINGVYLMNKEGKTIQKFIG